MRLVFFNEYRLGVLSEGKVVDQTWTGPAAYCARFKK